MGLPNHQQSSKTDNDPSTAGRFPKISYCAFHGKCSKSIASVQRADNTFSEEAVMTE